MKKYLLMHFKTSIEYKVSFILTMFAQLINIFASIFVITSLFNKFGVLKDFSLNECLLALSIVDLGYYYAEFIFRGFDSFSRLIKKGNFDILLVRPENIYLQILGSEIEITKISRLLATLGVFIYALIINNIDYSIMNIFILFISIVGSIITFASLMVIGAGLCFYTIEGLEIVNIFTCGSREMGEYPMGIYNNKLKLIFTFAIPLACFNYYPILYLLGRSDNILFAFAPIFTIVIVLFAILFFNHSLKHYQSSGS